MLWRKIRGRGCTLCVSSALPGEGSIRAVMRGTNVAGVFQKKIKQISSLREMRSKRKRVGSASHHAREMANQCMVMRRSMTGSNVSEQ